ncbi:hypothetical protein QL093DRAFT_2527069 [Fusarium oxysporum]|nr:hypothetical protein QL093DRAFT_2527069 [Fusarium oxysporum]
MGHKCLLVFSGISKTIPDLRKLYRNVCKELDRVLETPTFLFLLDKKKRKFLLGIWGHGDHGGYHRIAGNTQYFFVLFVEDRCDTIKEADLEMAISKASASCWSYDQFIRHPPTLNCYGDEFVKCYTEPTKNSDGPKPQIGKLSKIQRQAKGLPELRIGKSKPSALT